MKSGSSSSPHLDAGHGHHPVLPRGLEPRDRLPAVPDVLELPADALQLVRQLDPEQVVRRADVLSAAVAGVPGDHQLDLLEQSSVLFDTVADIGHVRFLRAFALCFAWICIYGYGWKSGGVPRSPQGERGPLAFDHATGRPVDDDEHRLS